MLKDFFKNLIEFLASATAAPGFSKTARRGQTSLNGHSAYVNKQSIESTENADQRGMICHYLLAAY